MDTESYISTGHLPPPDHVAALVEEAYERFKPNCEGQRSSVYPSLAAAREDLFGLCVVGTDGRLYATGDSVYEFPIMSVSKPFLFALVCEALGPEAARDRVGVNATGLPFNSLEALELSAGGKTNPMVNPGAIAATSLVPGASHQEKWQFIQGGLSRFAGRPLALNEPIFACASESNVRNREIAARLEALRQLSLDRTEAVDLYTRQCSLDVSAKDLAVMGATLANGGVNPVTRQRVINTESCKFALAVMATAGLYEKSGDWLYDVGLPGKSGISGGIVTVSPGKGALGTYAPPLDEAGNSVKGQLVARHLSERLGLNLFASKPEA
jgi:glutaminase